jgi:hypothetical protein
MLVVIIEVAVAKLKVLLLMIVEVDTTPFTDEVAILPEVVKLLDEITVVVATTPLTVEVNTFPVTDWVKALMIFVNAEVTPFTMVAKVLVVVDKVLVVEEAILDMARDPKLSGPVIVVVPASVDEADIRLLVMVFEAVRLVVNISVK